MILQNNQNIIGSNFDPLDQLNLIRKKCNNITSNLYKVNACYLEEIRNILPQAIRTSLFYLVTDQIKNDFGFSTVKSRKAFQFNIDKLVSNNISLLTIEHLNELAKKIEEENLRHINTANDEIANALKGKNNADISPTFYKGDSINLSSIPPLENLSIIEGWNGELKDSYSIDDQEKYMKSKKYEIDHFEDTNQKDELVLKDQDQKFDNFNLKANEIDILQSIFALTDEANPTELDTKKVNLTKEQNSYVDQKNNRLLPESPIGLYEWMISIDTALSRRLRDISHAINSELLRSGLVNTLVPLNILDAALAGQLVSSKSTSNILTLRLPSNISIGTGGLDIDCLLITASDLEFDNPRLRKNRSHLKYYQNVLLGMIKQQRYWQGRSLEEEVSNKWWKDTKKI